MLRSHLGRRPRGAAQGSGGAYVNPSGVVHDLITVGSACNCRLEGQPQTESSWFPGYAWTVLCCEGCFQFVGWRFTAEDGATRPRAFVGLRRSGVQLGPGRRRGAGGQAEAAGAGAAGGGGGGDQGGGSGEGDETGWLGRWPPWAVIRARRLLLAR